MIGWHDADMLRNAFILLMCLTCTACGFHPVYGVNKYQAVGVEQFMAATDIANIPDREGQILRNHLIDRFHRGGTQDARYRMEISPIRESIRDLDITVTSDSTRAQLRLSATMVLRDLPSGDVLLNQPLNSIVSYNILASEFSTRISENNARENGLNDMADKIESRVSLYFKRVSGQKL